jgi:polygalacturonase
MAFGSSRKCKRRTLSIGFIEPNQANKLLKSGDYYWLHLTRYGKIKAQLRIAMPHHGDEQLILMVFKIMKPCNYLPSCTPLLFSAAVFLSLVMTSLAQTTLPTLPSINTNNIINITSAPYNAIGDGSTDNTLAISNAIIAAAAGGATNGATGGTVEIPGPGTYMSGPLYMLSHVNLQVDSGAMLKFLPESQYPDATGNPAYPINNNSLTDIEFSGFGTIDGNGAGWWSANPPNRPYMIYFSKCVRVLIQSLTLQNPPMMHIVFKSGGGMITIQGITINTTGSSPNTDGIDLVGTNCLIQNCSISDGDDHLALGSSSLTSPCNNVLVTNCTFGVGHGVSLGGNTAGGVSNLMVINCTFSGSDYGIRMKSDNATSGGAGQGGTAQNLYYYNIEMTNITYAPIVIYSYYNKYGTPTTAKITPAVAAATNAATIGTYTPIWRNIIISNLTATSGQPGFIWARTEWPLTNIQLINVTNTASGSYQNFDIYHAKQVQIVNSQFINQKANNTNFWLYDADVTFSNTPASTGYISLYGITTNSYGNSLAFYKSPAVLSFTNLIGTGPLTLADSLLTISNNFTLFPATVLNYVLDSNTDQVAVVGNLGLGGTINVTTNASGFGAVTNTLLTYTGTLSGGLPTLGSTPGGPYNYSLNTGVAGQVNLIVTLPAPPAPTNLTSTATNLLINLNWNAVSGAASYNLKRGTASGGPYATVFSGLTATNYPDAAVTNAVPYYYVVTAVSVLGGESTNSLEVSATPLPSTAPVNITVPPLGNGQLQLSWPQDHLGWHLQIQTNNLNTGLGTNWVDAPESMITNQYSLPLNSTNGCVFLWLVYP